MGRRFEDTNAPPILVPLFFASFMGICIDLTKIPPQKTNCFSAKAYAFWHRCTCVFALIHTRLSAKTGGKSDVYARKVPNGNPLVGKRPPFRPYSRKPFGLPERKTATITFADENCSPRGHFFVILR